MSSLNTREEARLVINRLERLSADSRWAHRASGLRGSLLRTVEELDTTPNPDEELWQLLGELIHTGYDILTHAAREIRPPEIPHK